MEAFRKLNEQRPQTAFGIQMAMGMPPNPIQQKINETHITKALDLAGTSQSHEFYLGIADRVLHLVALIIVVGVAIFIIVIFKNQPAVLVPTLAGFGGFVAGVLSGMGISRALPRNKN